ncbi:MAG TPA: hypothetical protein VIM11_03570 [Tepidisphaeraceae bacterium]
MRRRLFTFASAVLLLLCAATVILWFLSQTMGYLLCRGNADGGLQISVADGELSVFQAAGEVAPNNYPFLNTGGRWELTRFWAEGRLPSRPDGIIERFGFKYRARHLLWSRFRQLVVPLWLLVGAFGVPPILLFRKRYLASSRWASARCPTCSYNLTANTSGVCPECGTPAEDKARANA